MSLLLEWLIKWKFGIQQLEEADKKIEKINPEEYDALSDRIIL